MSCIIISFVGNCTKLRRRHSLSIMIWATISVYILSAVIIGSAAFIVEFLHTQKYDYRNYILGIFFPVLLVILFLYTMGALLWEPIHILLSLILNIFKKKTFLFYYNSLWGGAKAIGYKPKKQN